ncbi:phosphoribosylglycinamide formyltransferase [Sediminicoccus sp. BL-A-41-H5]|uniref:phosphoribosylglycinamide formyltransferase n=1 Tax=Sediminicoccus sp. BL-A-41-H5 TaxID=3421106 RepID=UPI003D6660B4
MVALLEAAAHPDYPADIALVISNRADAGGLDRARDMGAPALVVPSRGRTREDFEAELSAVLAREGIEILALAGFMRVLTPGFVAAWEGRMINIHPSLLPSFPGLDTHARALAGGVRLHGCTVHLVSAGVDEGPILAQAAVPVQMHDTEESLAARVLEQEHRLYPAALAWLAAGRVRVRDGRAYVAAADARGRLVNPLPAGAAVSTQAPRD